MRLYFTNNSKQDKLLAKTLYPEDVYDEILTFFDNYKLRPHFIEITAFEGGCKIGWESQSEFFYCEEMTAEEVEELRELFGNG